MAGGLRESLRTSRWVWVVPIALLVTCVATIDWAACHHGRRPGRDVDARSPTDRASEELLFRGVVLTFLRDRYRERVAAAVTALLFGAIHVTAGPIQMMASAIFGYLLYYTRRVSGGIELPILVHAAWDSSVLTGVATADPVADPDTSPILFRRSVVVLVVLLVGHRAVQPRLPAPP